MFQKEQTKDENKTKYEHYNNQDLSSPQMVNIVNDQSVRQFASTPLLDNDVRVSYNLVNPAVSQVQHDVIQMGGGKKKKGKPSKDAKPSSNNQSSNNDRFVEQPDALTGEQRKFVGRIENEIGKKDNIPVKVFPPVVKKPAIEPKSDKKDSIGVEIPPRPNGEPPFINCKIVGKELDSFLALKLMAQLQREVYNWSLEYKLPDKKPAVLVNYIVNIKNKGVGQSYDYMQEVVYSESGAGYVSKEVNRERISVWNNRGDYTDQRDDGLNAEKDVYKGEHKITEDTAWLEQLANSSGKGGKATGDNGSKLTAENARFQLLMDDKTVTSDHTWYLLSTKSHIIYVNALNLTSNFNTVIKWRQEKVNGEEEQQDDKKKTQQDDKKKTQQDGKKKTQQDDKKKTQQDGKKKNQQVGQEEKKPNVKKLPIENEEIAAVCMTPGWTDTHGKPLVVEKAEWSETIFRFFSEGGKQQYFNIDWTFLNFIQFCENAGEGKTVIYMSGKKYEIDCKEFIKQYWELSVFDMLSTENQKTSDVLVELMKMNTINDKAIYLYDSKQRPNSPEKNGRSMGSYLLNEQIKRLIKDNRSNVGSVVPATGFELPDAVKVFLD